MHSGRGFARLTPPDNPGSRPRKVGMHAVLNSMFYILGSG